MRFLVEVQWFFVAGIGSSNLRTFTKDLIDRATSGANIKRSIRFHDVEGRLSARIVRWGRRKRLRRHIFVRRPTVGKKRGRKLERLWDRFSAYDRECERILSSQILDYLRGCMVRHEPIALEDFGGQGFRLVMRNEVAELLLLLERAQERLWAFVFMDNDLLSEENDRVGYVM